MDYVTLGKTGLQVSVLGLGSGGHSRLGTRRQQSDDNAVRVVRAAVDAGVNLIDSSEAYGTEHLIGRVVREVGRDKLILSTKLAYAVEGRCKTPTEIERSVDQSLHHLHTDVIDIYHVHAATVEDYPQIVAKVVPVLHRLREKGKLKFIGITERFTRDPAHHMLARAVQDDYWDVVMVGFNLLNPSARNLILKTARQKQIGVLGMFAVRQALVNPENLRRVLQALVDEGYLDSAEIDVNQPLKSVLLGDDIPLAEAAYRFCRYEPGIHSVLSGTGSTAHLAENIRAIHQPPLPPDVLARLESVFGGLNHLSGELP